MRRTLVLLACATLLVTVLPAGAADPPDFDYTTPLFGLNADSDGNLLVSDTGQGIVSLTQTEGELIAELPGVSDAVETEDGDLVAVTGQPPEEGIPGAMLFRISTDGEELIADLWEWEQENNPDQNDPLIGDDNIESNPYDVARIDGATLVADAAGNVLLEVKDDGTIEWKALFPAHEVTTQPLKDLVGCPDASEEAAEFCELPPAMPAQAVPTSVAVGPDGNYYVGELTGFPGTPGVSRIWRVSPNATNVVCGQDPGCEQVFESRQFTAVIDVAFGRDGTFYVLELDEDGFMAAEFGLGSGGTLNACDIATEGCVELATGLVFPTASAVGANGSVYATIAALMPNADVVELGKEFDDDNNSVHELDIAVLAAAGITRGCNPPANSSFCPEDGTTRGQMAAFLVRALELPASNDDSFVDDNGNVFEGDINALAAADITRGCNPPDNTEFCPDGTVTRGQMAAFLVRALELPASNDDAFVDDNGNEFEGDINALAAAGITRGCNPPDNDRFCPDDIVTRAQMASFLVRALDLG